MVDNSKPTSNELNFGGRTLKVINIQFASDIDDATKRQIQAGFLNAVDYVKLCEAVLSGSVYTDDQKTQGLGK